MSDVRDRGVSHLVSQTRLFVACRLKAAVHRQLSRDLIASGRVSYWNVVLKLDSTADVNKVDTFVGGAGTHHCGLESRVL
jgi:hypothetical protein